MSLKDQILSSDDRATEVVDVPEWGVKIALIAPSVAVRSKLIGDNSSDDDSFDITKLHVGMLIATAHDPDTGATLFDASDAEALGAKSAGVVQRLFEAAMRVSGLSADTETELGKD
jgi:hypothetical protein